MDNFITKKRKFKKINGTKFMLFMDSREIQKRIKVVAAQIACDYSNCTEPPILLVTLKGGMYFAVLLSMALDSIGFLHNIQTIKISRYSGDSKTGVITTTERKILLQHCKKFSGKDIIVVDDIFDEGVTLQTISNYLINIAKSIKFAVLVEKDKQRTKAIRVKINYAILSGVNADYWIVGTGMDTESLCRGLKGLWIKVTDQI